MLPTDASSTSDKTVSTDSPLRSPASEALPEKKLTSRYRGVCWNRKNKRWQSAINRAGRYLYLGSFLSEEEAARAFDRAAVKLRGLAAKINFAFADYAPEMTWYNRSACLGDVTDFVLKNPRVLRERVPLRPMQGPVPPYTPFSGHGTRPGMLGLQGTGQPNILHGQVINQRPVGIPAPKRNANSPMYYRPPFPGMAPQKQPMQPRGFMQRGNGMFRSVTGRPYKTQCTTYEPTLKPEPVTERTDRVLPLVNMPDGAKLTHLYHGEKSAFAMGFMREASSETEVLLYDGNSMHEVGSFSTKAGADEGCKALLHLLLSVKSQEGDLPNRSFDAGNPDRGCEGEQAVQFVDKLEGKSPFDIPFGSRPSFDSEKTADDGVCVRMKEEVGEPRHPVEAPDSDWPKSRSMADRMGSLLDLGSSICVDRLEKLPESTATPPGSDLANEASLKLGSSLSLINSGSLKNVLLVLNQSGNFSVFKSKDCEEGGRGENLDISDMFTFSPSEEPIGVETPTLASAERAMHTFRRDSSVETNGSLGFLRSRDDAFNGDRDIACLDPPVKKQRTASA